MENSRSEKNSVNNNLRKLAVSHEIQRGGGETSRVSLGAVYHSNYRRDAFVRRVNTA